MGTEQTTSAINTLFELCHNDNTCISKWFAYFVIFHYSPPFGNKSLMYAQRPIVFVLNQLLGRTSSSSITKMSNSSYLFCPIIQPSFGSSSVLCHTSPRSTILFLRSIKHFSSRETSHIAVSISEIADFLPSSSLFSRALTKCTCALSICLYNFCASSINLFIVVSCFIHCSLLLSPARGTSR